jgi:hypothetical protein
VATVGPLAERTAVVTGASRGIGAAAATALVGLGRAGKITQRVAEARSSTAEELRRLLGMGGVGMAA